MAIVACYAALFRNTWAGRPSIASASARVREHLVWRARRGVVASVAARGPRGRWQRISREQAGKGVAARPGARTNLRYASSPMPSGSATSRPLRCLRVGKFFSAWKLTVSTPSLRARQAAVPSPCRGPAVDGPFISAMFASHVPDAEQGIVSELNGSLNSCSNWCPYCLSDCTVPRPSAVTKHGCCRGQICNIPAVRAPPGGRRDRAPARGAQLPSPAAPRQSRPGHSVYRNRCRGPGKHGGSLPRCSLPAHAAAPAPLSAVCLRCTVCAGDRLFVLYV